MKYLFYALVVFASINGILSQYYLTVEDDDVRGYGYVSTPVILDRIQRLLNTLDHYRNKYLRGASGRADKFFSEVDLTKIYSEKIHELEAQLQEELQKNGNQACNKVFEKEKVQLTEEVQDLPQSVQFKIKMNLATVGVVEKTLNRMTERVNRYSAEAGDCHVIDNAQCELLAIYYRDLNGVYQENMQELGLELYKSNVTPQPSAKTAAEMSQTIADRIEKPVRACLSRSA